jgi:bifunctional non-homologous end joining protein LigD
MPATHVTQLPAPGAVRGDLPAVQLPELCTLATRPPVGPGWLTEIKFDGYRLIVSIKDGHVRLLTRNGLDWADRLPHIAAAFARLEPRRAMLDGELVALRQDGVSSFSDLQAALSAGADDTLHFYAFDLLHLDGWDLRRCALIDRKSLLGGLADWQGMLLYSAHFDGATPKLLRHVCAMGLEGIVCKQATSPYRSGRVGQWLKIKCGQREEFVVLGWTPPAGSRVGFGALHVGYFDPSGHLHYAGGVGSGYDDAELLHLRGLLDQLATDTPPALLVAGDPVDPSIHWVRPKLVIEVAFAGWSGAGRVRQAVYLGRREDKFPEQVVRDVANPEKERIMVRPRESRPQGAKPSRAREFAVPPVHPSDAMRKPSGSVVTARAPRAATERIGDVEITHPGRELWPGITKRDLAEYWHRVAAHALPGLARRPLSVVRCPDGITGQRFFQKNGHGALPHYIREGKVDGQPYLAIDDENGLIAMAQMSAIELHSWGATEADPLHPDRLVFDLDPGEGVGFADVVQAALEVRTRLTRLKLKSFCRSTGGKGLHVVVPLRPQADWEATKAFCRAFAETMTKDAPDRYVAHVKIADRKGRVLIDWLRNGLGATAVASLSPRARPGASVATPLAWSEVTPDLNPAAFTVRTIPDRLAALKRDPWAGFSSLDQVVPAVGSNGTRHASKR